MAPGQASQGSVGFACLHMCIHGPESLGSLSALLLHPDSSLLDQILQGSALNQIQQGTARAPPFVLFIVPLT